MMKVEDIKLALDKNRETHVQFANNINEIKSIQAEAQKLYTQLQNKGAKARDYLIDYEKDWGSLYGKADTYLKTCYDFNKKLKDLGINENQDVNKTIDGLDNMKDLMKTSYNIIKKTLVLN